MRHALAVVLLLIGGSANAAIVTYNDRGTFEGALSSFSVESFEGIAGENAVVSTTSGFTFGDVTYSSQGSGTYIAVVDPGVSSFYYERGTGAVIHSQQDGWMHMLVPSGVNAIGADFSTIYKGIGDLAIEFSTGESLLIANGDPWTFAGFISDQEIEWVRFGNFAGDYPLMDNFTYGATSSVVPIPAAAYLFASGLGLLGWFRRRQTA